MPWTVLIPVKALPEAKSRLLAATADPAAHERLVLAIRADTIAAAEAADGVARLLVVNDRDGVAGAFVQRVPGLNEGLTEASEHAARHWPNDGIAVLVADLPALRPAELAAALAEAVAHPRSFVADASGTGTTLLAARAGIALAPSFGAGSAARHAVSAALLAAGPGLRRDVDTAADLQAANELGVGPSTTAELANERSASSAAGGIMST